MLCESALRCPQDGTGLPVTRISKSLGNPAGRVLSYKRMLRSGFLYVYLTKGDNGVNTDLYSVRATDAFNGALNTQVKLNQQLTGTQNVVGVYPTPTGNGLGDKDFVVYTVSDGTTTSLWANAFDGSTTPTRLDNNAGDVAQVITTIDGWLYNLKTVELAQGDFKEENRDAVVWLSRGATKDAVYYKSIRNSFANPPVETIKELSAPLPTGTRISRIQSSPATDEIFIFLELSGNQTDTFYAVAVRGGDVVRINPSHASLKFGGQLVIGSFKSALVTTNGSVYTVPNGAQLASAPSVAVVLLIAAVLALVMAN